MMFGDFVAKVLDGAECAVFLLPILVISLAFILIERKEK